MSSTHDIDNGESLFQFDPYDEQPTTASSSMYSRTIVSLPKTMPPRDRALTSLEADIDAMDHDGDKGKERSLTMPMPIRPSVAMHDLFDASSPSVASTSSYGISENSITFSPTSSGSSDFGNRFRHRTLSIDSMEGMQSPESDISSLMDSPSGKGKERESFPVLPPLTFSLMQLDYNQIISSAPGPSSYGALCNSPPSTMVNLPPSPNRTHSSEPPLQSPPPESLPAKDQHNVSTPHVSRSRSLSNLSQQLSPLHGIVLSPAIDSESSFGPPRPPSNISRQLVLEKKDNNNNNNNNDATDKSPESSAVRADLLTIGLKEPRNYPPAWYTVAKPLALSPTVAAHTVTAPNPSPLGSLKGKGRSKSSPYPISALDFVPITSSDIFQPLPIVVVNYFDRVLPRELRLRILTALVEVHEEDHARAIAEGRWTMAKATSSKGRWVGRDKGIRELFKLSRVSKGWQALVFDGALWTDIDFHSFPGLPSSILVRLVQAAGTFARSLNLAGHVQLLPDPMSDITNALCLKAPEAPVSYTQLTNMNLQGCTYLTTRSIHHLLVRCKSLRVLSLKGLAAVTNTTCDIIANFCPALTSLNLSRCPNVDGHGVSALTVFALMRKEHLPLKELRISGLKYITDSMMQALGKAMPHLEVLDLSYARHLHNSAMEAFVACDLDIDKNPHALETAVVSARDLGREANESGKYRRRVTKLRHLVLSSCFMLTDTACANLAYSVPKLEFLELAGLGADLKDDGLICLLRTTPDIRRLDLEDASGISDLLLEALTPDPPPTRLQKGAAAPPKQPGHVLEYLNLSYASSINDDALIALIRNCPRLTGLEVDNTRVGPDVLREFVKLSRERKLSNARIVAVDCRGISEGVVKELAPHTRPRLGWRAYGARKLLYLDARDGNEEELKLGQDECDEARVVLKTFYSWQTVNAVQAAKEKRRLKNASRRTASESSMEAGNNEEEAGPTFRRSTRWWSPGGRRVTLDTIVRGRNTPPTTTQDLNNDGCRAM